ncbi:MAG: ABC transporter permease, partial [Bacteroidota bacterium]
LNQSGNWEAVQAYHNAIQVLLLTHLSISKSQEFQEVQKNKVIKRSLDLVNGLGNAWEHDRISVRLFTLDTLYRNRPFLSALSPQLAQVSAKFEVLQQNTHTWKKYVPRIIWHGTQNQYHLWLRGILKGNFGRSYRSGQPISQRIGDLFFWSFMITLISVFLAYVISLPLGILAARFQGSMFDRVLTLVVFALDSLPEFWVATLLLVTFANPDVLDWFPATFNTVSMGRDQSSLEAFMSNLSRLVLPLIAYTYGRIAFLTRIMRASMLEVVRQDYIRTARAKGLSSTRILLRHAFRNASLPIITGFASLFPMLVGGSIILENIFTIPGMGREIYQAIFTQDIPMIMAVFTLIGFMTVFGYLVSDILYVIANPRIKFTNRP